MMSEFCVKLRHFVYEQQRKIIKLVYLHGLVAEADREFVNLHELQHSGLCRLVPCRNCKVVGFEDWYLARIAK